MRGLRTISVPDEPGRQFCYGEQYRRRTGSRQSFSRLGPRAHGDRERSDISPLRDVLHGISHFEDPAIVKAGQNAVDRSIGSQQSRRLQRAMQHVRMGPPGARSLATCDVIHQTGCHPAEVAGYRVGYAYRETAPESDKCALPFQELKGGRRPGHFGESLDVAQQPGREKLEKILCRLLQSLSLEAAVARKQGTKDLELVLAALRVQDFKRNPYVFGVKNIGEALQHQGPAVDCVVNRGGCHVEKSKCDMHTQSPNQ